MGTVKDKLALLLGTKGSVREAISAMGQSVSDSNTFASYAAKIRAISSDATAAAGDILSGKTAYAGGKKITGSIASRGTGDLTASGATVSVPAGFYPSAVSKSVAAATQATPGISVSSSGLITASATQGAGYVAAGTKSATKQLTTQAAATITPGTSAKTAVAAGRYTTGAVQVAGDTNLKAENIKSGVSIFGVAGNLAPEGICTVTIVNRMGCDIFVSFGHIYYASIPTNQSAVITEKGGRVGYAYAIGEYPKYTLKPTFGSGAGTGIASGCISTLGTSQNHSVSVFQLNGTTATITFS